MQEIDINWDDLDDQIIRNFWPTEGETNYVVPPDIGLGGWTEGTMDTGYAELLDNSSYTEEPQPHVIIFQINVAGELHYIFSSMPPDDFPHSEDWSPIPIPLPATVWEEIPQVTGSQGLGTICPICRDDMLGNQTLRRLFCNHLFHESCIWDWLRQRPICPICRHDQRGSSPANA